MHLYLLGKLPERVGEINGIVRDVGINIDPTRDADWIFADESLQIGRVVT